MKQLVLAVLVGIAIAGAGLAAESVFAKSISQGSALSLQSHAPLQRVHTLPPIIVTPGD
jgi:hypothetical protein